MQAYAEPMADVRPTTDDPAPVYIVGMRLTFWDALRLVLIFLAVQLFLGAIGLAMLIVLRSA